MIQGAAKDKPGAVKITQKEFERILSKTTSH